MDEKSLVEQAKEQADRLEKLKVETDERIKKLEELQTQAIMGGRTTIAKPEEPKPSTPKEYIDALAKGKVLPR